MRVYVVGKASLISDLTEMGLKPFTRAIRWRSSSVERHPEEVGVGGSIPPVTTKERVANVGHGISLQN